MREVKPKRYRESLLSGKFMAVKKPAKMTKAAKKFKGARIKKKRGAKERPQRGGRR
jgi:hypothetical protein